MAAVTELPKMNQELAGAVREGLELKKVETTEKNVLPTKEDVAEEKQHVERIHEIEHFDSTKLHSTPVKEKIVLPSADDIKQEKQHLELTDKINNFPSENLKKTETIEKNVLPSPTDVAREKTLQMAASFDKSALHHVETIVSTDVRVTEAQ
ncbi:Thymosin beta [Caenorhabditis elegans]|uniref:Thymosin beta n=1 Tax=Caenorhabditis elegans TaxID=6239 RepID=TYB_CAEEL|nr:Thymosin beta [Caenorhabditis elegans]O17389.2 RecName: Full=Thymosin beta; AltName: Full=Tetrathymosin beta [Caenorhabditis elegans]CCD69031.1 Thymosin beta [Caenorhabditis elegans]|eukprot:NP_509430.1 Thymosin beta [Caenorhabditis elegans]